MNELHNQTIMVTGANAGLGKELSLELAKCGANVILVGKNIKGLEAVYDEICTKGWVEPAIIPINLATIGPDDLLESISNINQLYGKLDGLIHNAAITGPIAPVSLLQPHDWASVIQTNLNAPYLLTHSFMGLLEKSLAGNIVFILPEENVTKAYWSAYAASKRGLLTFAQCLAQELSSTNITVHTYHTKPMKTKMRVKTHPGVEPDSYLEPQAVAKEVIEIISTASSTRAVPTE